jgi:hypothetical protein
MDTNTSEPTPPICTHCQNAQERGAALERRRILRLIENLIVTTERGAYINPHKLWEAIGPDDYPDWIYRNT